MPSPALPQPQPLPRTARSPHPLQGCPMPTGFGNCATPWGNSAWQKGEPSANSVGLYTEGFIACSSPQQSPSPTQ